MDLSLTLFKDETGKPDADPVEVPGNLDQVNGQIPQYDAEEDDEDGPMVSYDNTKPSQDHEKNLWKGL